MLLINSRFYTSVEGFATVYIDSSYEAYQQIILTLLNLLRAFTLVVNIVLVNGKVIHGSKVETVVGGAKAFLVGAFSKTGSLPVVLTNLFWYKVVDAEVDGRKLKEVLVPLTSILYIYEE